MKLAATLNDLIRRHGVNSGTHDTAVADMIKKNVESLSMQRIVHHEERIKSNAMMEMLRKVHDSVKTYIPK
jgi:ribosomal protein L30/L7E